MKNIKQIGLSLLVLVNVLYCNEKDLSYDKKTQMSEQQYRQEQEYNLNNCITVNENKMAVGFGKTFKTFFKIGFVGFLNTFALNAVTGSIAFYSSVYKPYKDNGTLVCWNKESKEYETVKFDSLKDYYIAKNFKEPFTKFNFKNMINDFKSKRYWITGFVNAGIVLSFNYYKNTNNIKMFNDNYNVLISDCSNKKVTFDVSPDSLVIFSKINIMKQFFNNNEAIRKLYELGSFKESILIAISMCMVIAKTTDYNNNLLQDLLSTFKIKVNVVS